MSDAADPYRPLLDRQLEMLSELAEIGMELARCVGRQAAEGPSVERGADLPLAYARAARAVRLTLMLQARLIGAEQSGQAAFPAAAATEALKARAARLVEGFVREEHPDDPERVERLMAEAVERLNDDDLHGDILDQPISQTVGMICNDLRLSPARVAQALDLLDDAEAAPAPPRLPAQAEPGAMSWRERRRGSSCEVMWIGDPPRYCAALAQGPEASARRSWPPDPG